MKFRGGDKATMDSSPGNFFYILLRSAKLKNKHGNTDIPQLMIEMRF